MKKEIINFLKNELDNSYIIRNYVSIKVVENYIYITLKECVITLTNVGLGFGPLFGGWFNGCLTLSQCKELMTIFTNLNNFILGGCK